MQLMVVAASLGNKRQGKRHLSEIKDVMSQTVVRSEKRVFMWPANSAPCLQIADYCSWAIQKKWEKSGSRSYNLIKDKIATENDVFSGGTAFYF